MAVRRAIESRLGDSGNWGRYYHCPECAFSAGHATYCPSYTDWAAGQTSMDSEGSK